MAERERDNYGVSFSPFPKDEDELLAALERMVAVGAPGIKRMPWPRPIIHGAPRWLPDRLGGGVQRPQIPEILGPQEPIIVEQPSLPPEAGEPFAPAPEPTPPGGGGGGVYERPEEGPLEEPEVPYEPPYGTTPEHIEPPTAPAPEWPEGGYWPTPGPEEEEIEPGLPEDRPGITLGYPGYEPGAGELSIVEGETEEAPDDFAASYQPSYQPYEGYYRGAPANEGYLQGLFEDVMRNQGPEVEQARDIHGGQAFFEGTPEARQRARDELLEFFRSLYGA